MTSPALDREAERAARELEHAERVVAAAIGELPLLCSDDDFAAAAREVLDVGVLMWSQATRARALALLISHGIELGVGGVLRLVRQVEHEASAAATAVESDAAPGPATKRTRPPEGVELERGDHPELAERALEILRRQGPTVYADGALFQYEPASGVFVRVEHARVSRIVQAFAGLPVGKGSLKLRAADVRGAIALAADQAAEPEYFNAAPGGIAFRNGYVVVTADAIYLREHSPANRARWAYGFDFNAHAQPETLICALEQMWRDDGEDERAAKIAIVQEYMGASLLGLATRYQRVLVFSGAGANGKGLLSLVIEACMPPGSVCAIPPQDLGQEYRRALLAGKLLNIVSELPEADILDSESWKATVAGDPTTAREIRGAPFTFRPVAGHIYSANRLPGTTDQTHGFWRRLIVVRFGRVFGEREQDPTLAERIVAADRPAIVAWALNGAQRVLRTGRYTVPPSSTAAIGEWQHMADAVRSFIAERCELLAPNDPIGKCARAGDLYTAYREWSAANGHKALASNRFGERMKLIGLAAEHTDSGNRYRVRVRS